MITDSAAKPTYLITGILGCILAYSFFSFFAWKQIPIGDQVYELVASNSLAKNIATGYVELDSRVHPPGYTLAVSYIMRCLSIPVVKAGKVLGVICFLATVLLIYLILLQVSPAGHGHMAAILAVYLYSTSPAVIQGAQVLKQDTTILTVAVLLFVLAFIKWGQNISARTLVILGLFFGLALCTKLSTALVIPIALGTYLILKNKNTQGLFYSGIVSVVGICFLWSFWFVLRKMYPYPFSGLPFFCHFEVVSGEYGVRFVKPLMEQFRELGKGALVALWVSPYFVLLWLMAAAQRIRKYCASGVLQPQDFILLCAAIILAGYSVSGGLAHGFPRYQFPAISLCVITIVLFLSENISGEVNKRYLFFGVVLILISAVFNITVVGDIIYNAYYMLRFNAAFPDLAVTDISFHISLQMFYGLCLLLFSFWVCKRSFPKLAAMKSWLLVLLPLTLGANISQDILNARAPYQAGYTYGAAGVKEVIGLLSKEINENKKVLSPDDLSFHLPGVIVDKRMHDWTSPDVLIAIIREKNPDMLVYGLSSNSVIQYQKTFNNAEMLVFLRERFPVRKDVGSYTVWAR